MNSLEKIIMDEISSLPDMRLVDVLGFIRYLKMERHDAPAGIEAWFEYAIKVMRTHAEELNITEAAAEPEINSVQVK